MYRRRTFCRLGRPCTCHHCRHTGSDVLAIDDENRRVQTNRSRCRQRLQNANRSRRTLNQRCEHKANQQAQEGVLHLDEQITEKFRFAQRLHRRAHHGHPIEQNAKSADDLPNMLMVVIFTEHHHHDAQENRNWQMCIRDRYGILILEKLLLSDLQGDFRLFSANIFIFILSLIHIYVHPFVFGSSCRDRPRPWTCQIYRPYSNICR